MEHVKKVGKCLGAGAKGTVHLGYNEETGQFVAIKELNFAVVDGDDASQQAAIEIRNEVTLMQRATHENLVRYFGARRDGDKVQLIMEYVSGGSLASVIKRQEKLRESVIRSYTLDIVSGLSYLHNVCLTCHRDVKPENILITPEGRCKLADFGASRSLESTRLLKTCVGTPYYMAPEVVQGVGYDQSADIWSLGASIFEMITGRPPFAEVSNPMAIMFKIVQTNELPQLPQDVSGGLRDFVDRCCKGVPADRWTAQQLLQHPWLIAAGKATSKSSGDVTAALTTKSTSDGGATAPPQANDTVTSETNDGEDFPFFVQTQELATDPRRMCQDCKSALAVFQCDECERNRNGALYYRFCGTCWSKAHAHQRAAGHVKRPLLFAAPTIAANPAAASNQSRPMASGGVLLPDGNFVDVLCTGEQSEWTCGRCQTLNDGPLPECLMCGYER